MFGEATGSVRAVTRRFESGSAKDLGDDELAATLATATGELLLGVRDSMGFGDSAGLRHHGDRAAHEFLIDALARARPHDVVLSEEDDGSRRVAIDSPRLAAARVWIIDPLDGTREFGEEGRDDWAVHVALAIEGRAVIGAVALPALAVTLSTATPPVPPPAAHGAIRVVVSRTRPPAAALQIAEALGATLLEMGSAGAKAMAVVRGEADVYAHTGGQFEWDSCAPVAVATSAGLWCSRIDGSPLRYANADPHLPDLLICRPELADAAIAAANS